MRQIQSRSGVLATLSIGIGKDGESYEENWRNAGVALDMALSRGGDQAVIKTRYNFDFSAACPRNWKSTPRSSLA